MLLPTVRVSPLSGMLQLSLKSSSSSSSELEAVVARLTTAALVVAAVAGAMWAIGEPPGEAVTGAPSPPQVAVGPAGSPFGAVPAATVTPQEPARAPEAVPPRSTANYPRHSGR